MGACDLNLGLIVKVVKKFKQADPASEADIQCSSILNQLSVNGSLIEDIHVNQKRTKIFIRRSDFGLR